MKVLKLKRFITWVIVIVAALIAAALAVSVRGIAKSVPAAAEGENLRIVLSADPAELVKNDPYREFTITARLEGVESIDGGLYSAAVRLIPQEASILDFINCNEENGGIVPSKDVRKSQIDFYFSRHREGEYIGIEGTNNGTVIDEDFDIGGYRFKLKEGTEVPSSLTFKCESFKIPSFVDARVFQAETGFLTLNFRDVETDNTLGELTVTAGSEKLIDGTGENQTATDTVPYDDRSSVTLSAKRAGTYSKIEVKEGNITISSKDAKDVTDLALGELSEGEHEISVIVTAESGEVKTYTVRFTVEERILETTNTLGALTISLGNRTLISGTNKNQTISTPISYKDRGNLRITATRDGASSKLKVDAVKMEGEEEVSGSERTVVGERTGNIYNQSLGTLESGRHKFTLTVTSEAGIANKYTVTLFIAEENTKIVLSSSPATISKSNPYTEFIVTVRIEGVSYVPGGLFGASVRITPVPASSLEFIGFIKSEDVALSSTMRDSQHVAGIDVLMEGSNNGASAITDDFDVGSFKFKLKQGVPVPDSITFKYEDRGISAFEGDKRHLKRLYLESGTFTLNFVDVAPTDTPISEPVATVTENGYNGSVWDFTPAGMAELYLAGKVKLFAQAQNGAETEVGIDAFKQTNAGTYTIIARPQDGYYWESTGGTAIRTYSFTVKKAAIAAVQPTGNGELPSFTSDGYSGSLENIVTYKYFSDRACTVEVATENIVAGRKYYLKAVLKEGAEANFKFDADNITQVYASNGVAYTPKSTPISKPVAAVTENGYNGNAQDFTPTGMADLYSAGKVKLFAVAENGTETEVTIDAFTQTNAGSYQIVARPADGYCWEGISGSAAQSYSFTVNKAPIAAIPATEEGKLPMFRSDSYQGSLEDVVIYKYYSDEACTQEVDPSKLKAGQSYFLKAELKDGAEANFAFDPGEITQVYVSNGFAFTPTVEETKPSMGIVVGISVGAAVGLGAIGVIVMIILKKKKGGKDGTKAAAGKGKK